MKNKQVEQRVNNAFINATPNNLQSIQADCQRVPITTTNRRTTFMTKKWKIATLALALILVVAAVFGTVDLTQNAYAATVTIDVNPSIYIEIDGKQRVVSVTANNEDAEIILADIKDNLVGVKVNIAVKAILGAMLEKGYISEIANSVLVSVDPKKDWAYDDIVKAITDEIDIVMTDKNVDCSLVSQHVKKNQTVQELATKYDITIGKAQLIYKLLNIPANTYEEAKLAELTVNELTILLGNHYESDKDIDHKGQASDKAYITKQEALTAVVDYLNANNIIESLTEPLTVESVQLLNDFEIDLDFDNHTMVYEVDFDYGNYEYEIEVDATTGMVVDYKKSFNDDRGISVDKDITTEQKQELLNKIQSLIDERMGAGWFEANKQIVEIEFDKGEVEVEFYFEGKEYEMELDVNGKVVEHMPGGRQDYKPQNDAGNQDSTQVQGIISEDQAKTIVLNHAGIPLDATLIDYEIELEHNKHGNMVYYEIDFELDGYEYEAKVNAKTGTITRYSKERD